MDWPIAHTLQRPDADLAWWSFGEEGAPLVVFTHGGAMDHRMWAEQVAVPLPGFRVIVHDVRGHGISHCDATAFSLDAAADDLIAIIDAVGAGPAVLVGHSFGATISQLVALRAPERVRAFAAIGGACATIPHPTSARLRQAVNPLALTLMGQKRVRGMFAKMAGTQATTRTYAAEAIDMLNEEMFAAVMRTGFGPTAVAPADYRLGVSFLLLLGDQEPYSAFMRNTSRWVERDGGTLVTVPDAAHNANQDAPQAVNATLKAFLASL